MNEIDYRYLVIDYWYAQVILSKTWGGGHNSWVQQDEAPRVDVDNYKTNPLTYMIWMPVKFFSKEIYVTN